MSRRLLPLLALLLALTACSQDSDAAQSPPTFDAAREAIAQDDATVLVLGDSTGNGIDEWAALWGMSLTDRAAQMRTWDFELEEFAEDWTDLGGTGPGLSIWNLSYPGAQATYPLNRLDLVLDEPDVVVLNFGYNGTLDDAVPDLAELTGAVEKRWADTEIVVTLQGPCTEVAVNDWQTVQEDKVAAIREWASESGYPAIDVWAAFQDAPGEVSELVGEDGVHPNERGTAVWLGAVSQALG